MNLFVRYLILFVSIYPNFVLADYIVAGKITGRSMSWGGFVGNTYDVKGVRGEDGRMHQVARRYKSVSKYNARRQRCWVNTGRASDRDLGFLAYALNAFTQNNFIVVNDKGVTEETQLDHITFPCLKR